MVSLLIGKAKLPAKYMLDAEVLLKDSVQLYYMDEVTRKEGEKQQESLLNLIMDKSAHYLILAPFTAVKLDPLE